MQKVSPAKVEAFSADDFDPDDGITAARRRLLCPSRDVGLV
jgi:hypothetical protein